jgi:hypothetical protein
MRLILGYLGITSRRGMAALTNTIMQALLTRAAQKIYRRSATALMDD